MSDSKLFVLVLSIFFCLTTVQRNHIYFAEDFSGLNALQHKLRPKLPKIELEANFDEYFFDNKNNIQN